MDIRDANLIFDFSESTLKRAKNCENDFVNGNVNEKITRNRLSDEVIETIHNFFDVEIPFTSGRDFRTLTIPENELFKRYEEYCENNKIKSVGHTYFFEVLHKEKIHHSKDETMCLLCLEYSKVKDQTNLSAKQQQQLNKGILHHQLWTNQIRFYKSVKDMIAKGLKKVLLIIQDFTQVKVQGTFYQDLIICIYEHDDTDNEGLKRMYHHFIGETSYTSNDISFVVGVWKLMVQSNFFKGIEKIVIISDGGPKHFKISSNVSFFCQLQQFLKITVEYHFFERYHGHSVCDGVAAHAKKNLNKIQLIEQRPITTPDQIIEVIPFVKNHAGHVFHPSKDFKVDKIKTLHGIRSYYKWLFVGDEIRAYLNSHSNVITKVYKRANFDFFSDMEPIKNVEIDSSKEKLEMEVTIDGKEEFESEVTFDQDFNLNLNSVSSSSLSSSSSTTTSNPVHNYMGYSWNQNSCHIDCFLEVMYFSIKDNFPELLQEPISKDFLELDSFFCNNTSQTECLLEALKMRNKIGANDNIRDLFRYRIDNIFSDGSAVTSTSFIEHWIDIILKENRPNNLFLALKNDLTPLDVPYPCFQGNNFQTAVGQLENLIQTFPKFLFFMFTIRQQESQILQIRTIKYSYCGAFYYGERHFVCFL